MTAKPKEVITLQTKGQAGKSGLEATAAFTVVDKQLRLLLDIKGAAKDFDLMLNKNPFGLAAPNAALAFQGASPFSVPCVVDKKNLDAKNPPKSPFVLQVALKSSLDIFYFDVPCPLNCLVDFANPLKPDEFKKFWEMISKDNETTLAFPSLYPGYAQGDLAANLAEGLAANGFGGLAKVPKADGSSTMLYHGAKTINNLPLLLEVQVPKSAPVTVVFRVPVPPVKPLLEQALHLMLAADAPRKE